MELEVPGVRPRGRPRKQWKNNIEEDLRKMNLGNRCHRPRRLENIHEIVKPSSMEKMAIKTNHQVPYFKISHQKSKQLKKSHKSIEQPYLN